MLQDENGSFTVAQIKDLLNVSKVTAYAISQVPQLKRRKVAGQYRILKRDFWDWYNNQKNYVLIEDHLDSDQYFSSGDIAEMFGMTSDSASNLLKRIGLKSSISSTRCMVRKDLFINWYVYQFRYISNDPRLPPKEVVPTYDIHEIKRILGIKSNNTAYRLYKKHYFTTIRAGNMTLVDKQSFDHWFFQQVKDTVQEGDK